MLRLRINEIGVIRAMEAFMTAMTTDLGKAMQTAVTGILIPMIEDRLFNTDTSTSGYKDFLYNTMKGLSPDFVSYLGNASGWADVMEWQRKTSSGYKEGEITQAIGAALRASHAVNAGGVLAVGVGSIQELNNILPHLDGDRTIKLWEIINYGTGEGAGKGRVIRTGKQIFYNPKMVNQFGEHGILARQTSNPGFKGREYFVQLDGTMHEGDIAVKVEILNYINLLIKKYSYKGSGVRGSK